MKALCSCGRWLEAETSNELVDCECGNSFAVTVTEISATTPPSSVGSHRVE